MSTATDRPPIGLAMAVIAPLAGGGRSYCGRTAMRITPRFADTARHDRYSHSKPKGWTR